MTSRPSIFHHAYKWASQPMQQPELEKSPLHEPDFLGGMKTLPHLQIERTVSPKQKKSEGPINQSSRPVAVLVR